MRVGPTHSEPRGVAPSQKEFCSQVANRKKLTGTRRREAAFSHSNGS